MYNALGRAVEAGQVQPILQPVDGNPFRKETADWLDNHMAGRFAQLKGRGGAGDGEAMPELRKEWETELAKGGRGLSVADQVVFNEEYARAGGPGRMGHIGEGLMAPTLVAWGSED